MHGVAVRAESIRGTESGGPRVTEVLTQRRVLSERAESALWLHSPWRSRRTKPALECVLVPISETQAAVEL